MAAKAARGDSPTGPGGPSPRQRAGRPALAAKAVGRSGRPTVAAKADRLGRAASVEAEAAVRRSGTRTGPCGQAAVAAQAGSPRQRPGLRSQKAAIDRGGPSPLGIAATSPGGPSLLATSPTGRGGPSRPATGADKPWRPKPSGDAATGRGGPSRSRTGGKPWRPKPDGRAGDKPSRPKPEGRPDRRARRTIRVRPTTARRARSVDARAARGW